MAVMDLAGVCVVVCASSRLFTISIELNDLFIAKNVINNAQHEHNAWWLRAEQCYVLHCNRFAHTTTRLLCHSAAASDKHQASDLI